MKKIIFAGCGFLFVLFFVKLFAAADEAHRPGLPEFYLNGRPAFATIQDLSGLVSRPLRILIKKNNRRLNEEWIQAYALGVREGDLLRIDLAVSAPGLRGTVYKILREQEGPRYLTMPVSFYFDRPGVRSFEEIIEPFSEQCFIVVYEKTDLPDEKNINIRYFEERVRNLVIASYKTNLLLSSLKFKLKDFSGEGKEKFFERDAQLLINRFTRPQRIFLIRLWHASSR